MYGVNHLMLNLKYASRPAVEIIEEIGEKRIPDFSSLDPRPWWQGALGGKFSHNGLEHIQGKGLY